MRSSSTRVIRVPDNERSTTVANASGVPSATMHNTRNRCPSSKASDTKSNDQRWLARSGTRMGLWVPKPACATVCGAPPALLHDRAETASYGSLRTLLWRVRCPNGDIQTGVVHSPVRAAVCVRHRRFGPASYARRSTCEDRPTYTPDVQIGRADPSRPTQPVS